MKDTTFYNLLMSFIRSRREYFINTNQLKAKTMAHNHTEDDEMDEGMELEEVVDENNLLINALLKLLIKKKLITEQELDKAIEELENEE